MMEAVGFYMITVSVMKGLSIYDHYLIVKRVFRMTIIRTAII